MLNCFMVLNIMFQLLQLVVLHLVRLVKNAGFAGAKNHSFAVFSMETRSSDMALKGSLHFLRAFQCYTVGFTQVPLN